MIQGRQPARSLWRSAAALLVGTGGPDLPLRRRTRTQRAAAVASRVLALPLQPLVDCESPGPPPAAGRRLA